MTKDKNESKCIITSASSKFFPSLLNLLGSIEVNYPNHPDVYVYDLGLFYTFRKELESIPWVHVLDIPHFVPHWRSCYTWKTYILNTPLTELNFYIDAGCQILKSLDQLFEKINIQGYLAVDQGKEIKIKDITPKDYLNIYKLDKIDAEKKVIAAGIFGFKENSIIKEMTEELYKAGINKLCLGFSKNEMWKNKSINKNNFTRDCIFFRHDTTLISILLTKYIPNPLIEDVLYFSDKNEHSDFQFIWNFRMNYKKLFFTESIILHKKINFYAVNNRLFLYIFIFIKNISNNIKQKCFHS